MSVRSQIRNFIRVFRQTKPPSPNRHHGHSLARTVKHGTTITGPNDTSLGSVGSERRNNLMAESADRYDASFKKSE